MTHFDYPDPPLTAENWDRGTDFWIQIKYFGTGDALACPFIHRKLRLFMVATVRSVAYLLVDPRSVAALDAAESYADNPDEELLQHAALDAEAAHQHICSQYDSARETENWPGTSVSLLLADRAASEACICLVRELTAEYPEYLGVWFSPLNGMLQLLLTKNHTHPGLRNLGLRFIHDIFGNPFRPVAFAPEWRSSSAVGLAQSMYESREFSPMPILADALEEAGCDNPEILSHCRGDGPHVRGCWVVDLVLGKA